MIISNQKINFSAETRSNIAVMETKLEKCYDKKNLLRESLVLPTKAQVCPTVDPKKLQKYLRKL